MVKRLSDTDQDQSKLENLPNPVNASDAATKDYVDNGLSAKASSAHTHMKSQVGLSDVDNTSDINKPISQATQAALDTKLTASSNLSEITNAAAARANLGLGALPMIAELARHDVSSSEATIDIIGLSQDYDDIMIDVYLISNRNSSSGSDRLDMWVGGSSVDTGANYSWRERLYGGSSDAWSTAKEQSSTKLRMGGLVATTHSNEMTSFGRIVIRQYAETTMYRTIYAKGGGAYNSGATEGTGLWLSEAMGTWRNKSSGIQRLRFAPGVGTAFTAGYVRVIGMMPGCAYV